MVMVRQENLEKKFGWLADPENAKDVLEGLKLLRKKEKGT